MKTKITFDSIINTIFLSVCSIAVIFAVFSLVVQMVKPNWYIKYRYPYEYSIWMECINSVDEFKCYEDRSTHKLYTFGKGKYCIELNCESDNPNRFRTIITDGPNILYNSDPLVMSEIRFPRLSRELAHKIYTNNF